jgi:hypothetical protein
VRLDPKLLRPAEVDHLIGNPAKARSVLGWEPTVDFQRLVGMMVTGKWVGRLFPHVGIRRKNPPDPIFRALDHGLLSLEPERFHKHIALST